jgi:CubicO group peptidase (beta-lactamase class C family)
MMKRRDLLRTLGAVGAVTAVERLLDPAAIGGQSLPTVSSRSTTDNLASQLAASIQKHKVPGASAAVFRAGQWEVAAAGVTNVTTGVDVTTETVMHIGSITKVLNATLVMQLVDEGQVELAAPLKRYLPDFQVADRDATELITVEMLLNHTSGIDGEFFPDAGPDAERIEDVIPRIARQGQIHPPGAELSYGNSGAVLAGYLAQRLLGKRLPYVGEYENSSKASQPTLGAAITRSRQHAVGSNIQVGISTDRRLRSSSRPHRHTERPCLTSTSYTATARPNHGCHG